MANKKEVAEALGAESTQTETVVQVITEQAPMIISADTVKLDELKQYFDVFSEQDTHLLKSLTADYLEMVEHTTYNFICTGMTTFLTAEGEDRPAAVLVDKENKTFINGGAVLVSSCKKLKEYPSFVRIVTGAKVKSDKGKYLSMEVRTI